MQVDSTCNKERQIMKTSHLFGSPVESTKGPTRASMRGGVVKKLSIALAVMAVLAGVLCATGFGPKSYRLGGGWVGGNALYTWSALFAPSDPLGQTAAVRPVLKYFGSQFAGLLSSFGADNLSDATG